MYKLGLEAINITVCMQVCIKFLFSHNTRVIMYIPEFPSTINNVLITCCVTTYVHDNLIVVQ